MAEFVHEEVVEQILIGLDVEDLISCKSVCKSWHSLITSPGFISRHLNHSYNQDLHNNELAHRRIILDYEFSCPYDAAANVDAEHFLLGSSNGLVCISPFRSKLLVVNPLTREVRRLGLPRWTGHPLFWGFGYDSLRDDYKVIVWENIGPNQIRVQVLSLKSNIWRVIGEVKYELLSEEDGLSCNGVLYWIVSDENKKSLIISFDLSKEEFKEIPQPDDARYELTDSSFLGIIKGYLCVCQDLTYDIWLMKEHESWELMKRDDDGEMKYDIVHCLTAPLNDRVLLEIQENYYNYWNYVDAPIFVPSLVSPHVAKVDSV